MASNYTENYGLCQWEATDAVLRTDFNEDNRKIEAALNKMASCNCQIYTTIYIGTGQGGRTFTFPHKPIAVFVLGGFATFMCAFRGTSDIFLRYGNVVGASKATWEGNTLTWSQSGDSAPLSANFEGQAYVLVALLDIDA